MQREFTEKKAAEQVRRKVRETVKRYGLLKQGDHIVIGLSGGPDSVCLFFLLIELAKEYRLTLHPVHVNHRLRGQAAEADQKYVEELCQSQQLLCTVVRRNVEECAAQLGVGTEEAGRLVRYQAFKDVGQLVCPCGGAKVAVAQNRNDQAETALMRILRGTGTQGLAAMEPCSKEGIIRPLLFVDRQEIEAFCQEEGLSPRIDATNLEPLYLRNRIRLELLPLLEEQYNEKIVGALARLASIAAEDRDYFQRQTEEFLRIHGVFCCQSAQIPQKELVRLHPALRKRVIVELFSRLGLKKDVSSVHLDQAERLLEENRTSSQAFFPEGWRMRLAYEEAVFEQVAVPKKARQEEETKSLQTHSVFRLSHSFPTGEKILTIHCQDVLTQRFSGKMMGEEAFRLKKWEKGGADEANSLVGLFDADELIKLAGQQGLWIRTRRPGDRIRLSGMEGSKKLQDFFVDKKVPKEVRDQMPLFCFGQNVLWIPGLRAGRDCVVNGETQMILLLEYYK